MNQNDDKALLDELGVEYDLKKKINKTPQEEFIISQFLEIQQFYKNKNHLPKNHISRNIFERIYAIRLSKIKSFKECHVYIKPIDYQNLLDMEFENNEMISKEEISNNELVSELFMDEDQSSITNLKHVRTAQERKIVDEFAKREICKNFSEYKTIFKQLQMEIENGNRELIVLKNRPEIRKGDFFILYGQKTFVADVGKLFMQEYGINDARLYLIFDNGTESRMLMRSFQKALSLDDSARLISKNNLGPLFSNEVKNEDLFSGNLYILRSYSENPEIKANRNLIHKIGFTTGKIERRISNAKTDPTFLMAEVEVVASYKLFNIKSSKFENLVQKIFDNSKLDIIIKDRFGNPVKPDEWFFVPLDVIKDAVQKIIDGSITKYFYDPSKAKLIEIS